jgi:CRISPR type III-B/RAMP module RAMP protein Cmr1
MDTLAKLQESLIDDENLLLRVKVSILFPHVGGYSTLPFDPATGMLEPLRPTELKALWRWWARVVLSAACGGKKDYKDLDIKIGKLLGSTGEKSTSSLFAVHISIDDYNALRQRVMNSSRENYNKFRNFGKEISELFNEFARVAGVRCRVDKVNINSFQSIQINFKGDGRRLNEKLKSLGINIRINHRGSLNLSPKKIEELKKVSEATKGGGGRGNDRLMTDLESFFKHGGIARLFLLSQKRKDEEYEYYLRRLAAEAAVINNLSKVKATIELRLSRLRGKVMRDEADISFALWTFMSSLIFGAIGYASRRGFGSIVIERIEKGPALSRLEGSSSNSSLKNDFSVLEKTLNSLNTTDNPDEVKRSLNFILEESLKRALKYAQVSQGGIDINDIPKVPSAIPNSDYFRIEVFKCSEPLHALQCISKSTLKAEWVRVVRSNPKINTLPSQFHTWILGLPRGKPGNGGYFIDQEGRSTGRRASAIHFKLWENEHGTFIFTYGFLSRDWSKDYRVPEIYHVSRRKRGSRGKPAIVSNMSVMRPSGRPYSSSDTNFLVNVFDSAFGFISKIVKKCCGADAHAGKSS